MSEGDIFCNFKKCRKILTEIAFVTRCSHAFCEEDAMREIQNDRIQKKCPACLTPLADTYDLVKVHLNPNEEFKSMVLAGIRPEYVMDIATRSIAFWTYQINQDYLHQKKVSKNLKDALTQMKINNETECVLLKSEIQVLKRKINYLEKELDKQNIKCCELSQTIIERDREIQRWQMSCEATRRKQASDVAGAHHEDRTKQFFNNCSVTANLGPQTMDEILRHGISSRPDSPLNYEKVSGKHSDIPFVEADDRSLLRGTEAKLGSFGFHFQPKPEAFRFPTRTFFDRGVDKNIQFDKKYEN